MTVLNDWNHEDDGEDWQPAYAHPDCVDPCSSAIYETCCKYPATPLTRRVGGLVQTITTTPVPLRDPEDELVETMPGREIARLVAGIDDMAAELDRLDVKDLPTTELFQLACFVAQVREHFQYPFCYLIPAVSADRLHELTRALSGTDRQSQQLWGELRVRRGDAR